MLFPVVLLCAALAAVQVEAEPRIYCGGQLSDMVEYVCNDYQPVGKRAPAVHQVMGAEWPFMEREAALSMKRGKRQIVAECCDRPCEIEEIAEYCP